MRVSTAVLALALASAPASAQDVGTVCRAAAVAIGNASNATAEQTKFVIAQRVNIALLFDVPQERRDELQKMIDALVAMQNAEMDQTITDAELVLDRCQQR